MLNNLSGFFFVVTTILSCLARLPEILLVFQQTHYDLKRYLVWWKENILVICGKYLVPLILVVLTLIFGLWKRQFWLSYFIAGGLLLLMAYGIWKRQKSKTFIKPLVYTARVYRQIVVFIFLDLTLIALILLLARRVSPLISSAVFFLAPLNYCLLFVMGALTSPVEKLVHQSFINKASKILATYDSLIKIGITGSYGKTSTKNIVNEVVSQKYYSLMTPASYNTPMGIVRTIREMLKPIHQVFVCEMGAARVGDISQLMDFVKPRIGLVTAIGAQHLATFGNQENIIREKMMMIEKLPISGLGVLNYDNDFIRYYKIKNQCRIVSYGITSTDVDYQAVDIKYSDEGSSFKVKTKNAKTYSFKTKLLGSHNILNSLAAIAIGRELSIEWADLQTAVAAVSQIANRLEIKPYKKHTMIDDSFNSNPSGAYSALQVLKMMKKPRVLITSGMIDLGKKQNELNQEFGRNVIDCADYVILVGEKQTQAIYQGLSESGFPLDNVKVVKTTLLAFAELEEIAKGKALTFLVENDLPDAFNV